nr:ATP-binding protein [Leptolyngbya sp. FACHB-17]
MATLLRSHDWSQTPLGEIETWSDSLKTAVQTLLTELDRAKQPEQAPPELQADQPQDCRSASAHQAAQAAAFRGRLTKALRPLTDADDIQAIAARILGESLGASRVIYIEVLPGDQEVIVHKNYTNGVTELSGLYRLEDFGRNLTADHRAGRTAIVPDVANYPQYTPDETARYRSIEIAAHIDVPLIKNNRFVALLAVHQATPRQWTEDEVKRVEETAEQTWATVERARAEAALRQSEEQSRKILESIAEAFFALDENWRFTHVNRSAEILLDRTPGDLLGKHLWEEYPGLRGNELAQPYWSAMRDRVAASLTAFYPDHDRWYEVRTYPAPNGISVYFRNVTEQMQTETALRQSEERYRTLFESIDEGFCVVEVLLNDQDTPIDYRILEINPAFEQQTGLRQAVGQTARQLNLEEHWIEIYGQVALTGESVRFENSSQTLNRWFDVYACRTGEPEAHKVAIIFKDISDRKRAEESLRQAAAFNAFCVSLSDALRSLADSIEIQAVASRMLGEYLGANRVAYFEVNGADYVVQRDYVNGADALAGSYPIDSFGPKLLAAYRMGRTVSTSDVQADPHLSSEQRAAYAAIQIGAYIGIPLIKGDEFVAGLAVHSAPSRTWTPVEVTLAEEVAERTWAAVERAHAEAALRDSENRFRMAIEAAQLGTWDWNLLTNQLRWDEGCKAMFGLPPEAESSIEVFFAGLHPDDRELLEQIMAWTLNPASSGKYDTEYRTIGLQDGVERWVAARGQVYFDAADKPQRFVGTVLNITEQKRIEVEREQLLTERKQTAVEREQLLQQEQILRQQAEIAERKLYDLLASIREDFLLFNHDWRVAYLNPQAEITMQRPRDQILGHRIWELFPDLVGTEYYHRLHQVMREQVPVQFEYHYDTWDVWFDNRVYPSPEGITILCSNITNRKRAEAEREQLLQQEQIAREAAENANRIKDEFLAVLSHELRSPLNPILGWSKLLQQGKLDTARTTTALMTIERNAQLQVQLIDDLLDISRILQGKLSLNVLPVDLSTVISEALETVRLAAEAKTIQIDTTLSPGVGMVMGDAGRLQQVVWNLLSNAVKFTPQGGHVTVALASDEHHAQIQVRDTGKGIKSDFLPYVFEHFRQEDGATTRKFGGLGLGLAIVRQIVELHGGTVAVESLGEGAGATFTVQIPLTSRFAVLPTIKPRSSATEDLSGIHILVVDDEADSREFVAFVLEQAGAIVTAVASGIEALQAFSQALPNILVSDVGMPEMDGYMLMRQIRSLPLEQGGQIPAIALTAYAGELDHQQAIAAGFQRHIPKPIDSEVVITIITELVSSAGIVNLTGDVQN